MVKLAPGAAILVACAAFPAFAADWKVANLALASDNRGVTYVDSQAVRPKGSKLRFRSEQYLEHRKFNYDRISRLSEVDCTSLTQTVLRESYHFGRVLVSFGSTPRISNHYSRSSADHLMLRRICAGNYLSASVADHGKDAAILFGRDWKPVPGQLSLAVPVSVPVSLPTAKGVQVAEKNKSLTLAARR